MSWDDFDEQEPVEVEFTARRSETEKAVLFVIEGEENWVPKSQTVEDDGDDEGTIKVTQWLAEQEGWA